MYGKVAGGSAVVGGVGAAVVLPNTGSADMLIVLAASVASGLVAWGLTYFYAGK